MKIDLNGNAIELEPGATVADAVAATGAEGRGIAAAVDGAVIPRSEWQITKIREGQQVEVLQAVQGG